MKVWVTKYWETQGVYQIPVERKDNDAYVWSIVKADDARCGCVSQMFRLGRDAFEDKLDAEARVLKEWDKRLSTLRARVADLESLDTAKLFNPRTKRKT